MAALEMDKAFAERNVNEGFSGGEKKRHEILQLELLKPKIAILDETDSGLDVDALRVVSRGREPGPRDRRVGTLLITHYTRILRYIEPDFVHVFFDGRIVESGGAELADRLENEGYGRFGGERDRGRMTGPDMTLRRRGGPQGLPDPERAGRTGVPLVYLDSANTLAEAAAGHRRAEPTSTPITTPTSPERCTRWAGGDRAPTRAPGTRWRRSSTPRARRGDLHQEHHRGAEPAGLRVSTPRLRRRRAVPPRSRRRDRGHRDGAPQQHRAVAAARAAHRRRRLRWIPLTDDGRLDLVGHRRGDQRAHQGRLVRPPVQRAGHDQPGRRDRGAGAGGRRDRRSSTPRSRPRTCRSTCRRSAPTSSPSPATRCYGPTGIGVLWGRYELLAELPPFLGGGEMIETVEMTGSTFAAAAAPVRGRHADDRPGGRARRGRRLPDRARHGQRPRARARADRATRWTRCRRVDGLRIIGPADGRRSRGDDLVHRCAGIHPHDVAQLLDEQGIAVRAGHHCARPVCVRYGIPATTRASFCVYTTTGRDRRAGRGARAGVKRFFG